ncbi:hypothetical protein ACQEVM_17870 [Streptomyces sp. CA-243310]|uniref:hypothetical protein n=1 Tax=Streptomyces sp. CA-243310 TaxID=3240056 RepID=UPI003D8E161A
MTRDLVVRLRGGTYRLSAPFQLGPADSGTGGHTVIYQAYPGEQPLLSGAKRITGFVQVDAAKNIWRAPAPADAQGLQLYVNGQRADRTRSVANPAGFAKTSTGFTTSDDSYSTWHNPSDVQVIARKEWKHLRCPLSGIGSLGGSNLYVAQPCWGNTTASPNPGFPFNGAGSVSMDSISWLENAHELLHSPGQFYLDRTGSVSGAGTPQVYYIPRSGENPATADVELPVLESLVNASGTPGHLSPVNDSAAGAVYAGSWAVAAGRGFGDLADDVHATAVNGDSMSYTFTGTGVDVLGETNGDEGGFDVYVDGIRTARSSADGPVRLAQQVIASVTGLAKGRHTVKLVKTGGRFLTVDGFTVLPDALAPVHDITFEGVTFSYATWLRPGSAEGYADNQAGVLWSGPSAEVVRTPGAVSIRRGRQIKITGGEISHVGGLAVDFADGTQGSSVTGNRIHDVSGGGVSVGEVDDYYLTDTARMTSGDIVSNNAIFNIGVEYEDAVGIMVGNSRTVTLAHNEIAHTPYSGISLGWGWGWASPGNRRGSIYSGGNRILNNAIHDSMRTLTDGGAIYTLGGQGNGDATGSAPSTVAGNVMTIASGTGGAQGLYHDEGSSHWNTHGNVVSQVGGHWTFEWTGSIHDITIHDNLTDTDRIRNEGTNVSVTDTTVVGDGLWPQVARDIAAASGLEPAYRSLMPARADLLNDGEPAGGLTGAPVAVAWTGNWGVSSTRPYGDLAGDVHYTQTDGDFVTVTFTGTGIRVLGELSDDQGPLTVTLDGAAAGTVTAHTAGPRQARAVIYRTQNLPYGSHTLTLAKNGGRHATIDGFQLDRSVNDDDPSLAYTGSWNRHTARGFGDHQDDVHYTTTDGDFVTATFTGTGADVVTETNSDEGAIAVFVDGRPCGTVNATAATRNAQQRVFTIDDLRYGVHVIKLVKAGGQYFLIDRMTYR